MYQIVGKPKLTTTNSGRKVLEVSQNVAPYGKDRQTGQYAQQGADLWLRGSIWDSEKGPDPEAIAANCPPEWRVILQADRIKRSEYAGSDGQTRVQDELHFPRFVGYQPPRELLRGQNAAQPFAGQPNSPTGGYSGTPATNGPQNGTYASQGYTGFTGGDNAAPF